MSEIKFRRAKPKNVRFTGNPLVSSVDKKRVELIECLPTNLANLGTLGGMLAAKNKSSVIQ
jgi:hypothetical protein